MSAPDSIYAGTVMSFGGDPASLDTTFWVLCDGTVYLQSKYPDLFAVLQNVYGGDPSTTFAVPDYRGYFLRGADRGAGVDPNSGSRTWVGTAPANPIAGSPGTLQSSATGLPQSTSSTPFLASVPNMIISTFDSLGATSSAPSPNSAGDNATSFSGGDGDTRPANVYAQFIIKTTNG